MVVHRFCWCNGRCSSVAGSCPGSRPGFLGSWPCCAFRCISRSAFTKLLVEMPLATALGGCLSAPGNTAAVDLQRWPAYFFAGIKGVGQNLWWPSRRLRVLLSPSYLWQALSVFRLCFAFQNAAGVDVRARSATQFLGEHGRKRNNASTNSCNSSASGAGSALTVDDALAHGMKPCQLLDPGVSAGPSWSFSRRSCRLLCSGRRRKQDTGSRPGDPTI